MIMKGCTNQYCFTRFSQNSVFFRGGWGLLLLLKERTTLNGRIEQETRCRKDQSNLVTYRLVKENC